MSKAKIWIDDKLHEADPRRNMLDVSLELGYNLPYFCWHPAMGSVGACRQCAVKQYRDDKDTRGRLVMACMTPASEGTRIGIADVEAKAFRKSVIEWLMVSHPHDCPICDEGGECHLQDMTVMAGHNYRRYRFTKRTFTNQDLGPLVNHEMNRCIQCYRCVRFYRDFAGGRDLHAMGAHDNVYFGRHEDGVLESEFAGNLVEVCPTGVFTDKTLKSHYNRKWDLQTAPSVCVHCSLGCNTIPGERYGELRRVRARYNGAVNGYFLCDRGRYGYEFTSHERRIKSALRPRGAETEAEPLSPGAAAAAVASLFTKARKPIGIGSPRACLEANFALRALVGKERFYQGVAARERTLVAGALRLLREGPARGASLRELERADAVLVLGEDVSNTAPMAALALTQSIRQKTYALADKAQLPRWHDAAIRELVQDEKGPLFVVTPAPTRLDGFATSVLRAAPVEVARLGHAVAHALDASLPEVFRLSQETQDLAKTIAAALKGAVRPLVVSGTGAQSEAVIEAAASIAWALGRKREAGPGELFYVLPECNSFGLELLGGAGIEDALAAIASGEADMAVVLENDLFRRAARPELERALERLEELVVVDCIAHETAARASIVLPAASFAEGDGTLVNNEGRAQRFLQVFVPEAPIQESWRWLRDVAIAAGKREAEAWKALDDLTAAVAAAEPALARIPEAAPAASFRIAGSKIPRMPHRYTGRTAMIADRTVHEPKPPGDPDTPMSFSMEGYETPLTGQQGDGKPGVPSALLSHFWSPGWNSIQALNRFQEEIAGPLRGGDPGVRLVEPKVPGRTIVSSAPEAFARRAGSFAVVVLSHVFGSEELSVLAPGIAALAPAAYAALNPQDAAEAGIAEGDLVELESDGGALRLPAKLLELPQGVVGLPEGVPGLVLGKLPEWVRLRRPSGAPR